MALTTSVAKKNANFTFKIRLQMYFFRKFSEIVFTITNTVILMSWNCSQNWCFYILNFISIIRILICRWRRVHWFRNLSICRTINFSSFISTHSAIYTNDVIDVLFIFDIFRKVISFIRICYFLVFPSTVWIHIGDAAQLIFLEVKESALLLKKWQ